MRPPCTPHKRKSSSIQPRKRGSSKRKSAKKKKRAPAKKRKAAPAKRGSREVRELPTKKKAAKKKTAAQKKRSVASKKTWAKRKKRQRLLDAMTDFRHIELPTRDELYEYLKWASKAFDIEISDMYRMYFGYGVEGLETSPDVWEQ